MNTANLVPIEHHNRLTMGPAAWTDTRVPANVFMVAQAVYGTSSEDDDKRIYRTLQAALWKLAESQAPAVGADRDVTRILLDVVPGEDGMGEEVYAKSVEDVVAVLTRMGQQIEDLQAAPAASERAVAAKCAAICAELEAGYKEVRDQLGEPVVGCVYSHLADGAEVCAAEIRERFGIAESEPPVHHTGEKS